MIFGELRPYFFLSGFPFPFYALVSFSHHILQIWLQFTASSLSSISLSYVRFFSSSLLFFLFFAIILLGCCFGGDAVMLVYDVCISIGLFVLSLYQATSFFPLFSLFTFLSLLSPVFFLSPSSFSFHLLSSSAVTVIVVVTFYTTCRFDRVCLRFFLLPCLILYVYLYVFFSSSSLLLLRA